MCVVNFTLQPVFLMKETQCPLTGGRVGPVGSVDAFEQRKNVLPLSGVKPRFVGCADRSVVTLLTELPTRRR